MKFSAGMNKLRMKKLRPECSGRNEKKYKNQPLSKSIDQKQCDRIGPIFAYWAIVFT
jgi:hypothetical protein